VRKGLVKIKVRLLRQLSVLRPSEVHISFSELREIQKRRLGKTTKEMLVGEYFNLPNDEDMRILKVETKNKKALYVVVRSITDYQRGTIDILKAKKFLKFKDAWRFYSASRKEWDQG